MGLPEPAAFEAVVLPHLDAGYNLARWLVADASLAEDVLQDASLRALSYFASFRGGDARAWFLRIVRHTAYDALAARRGARVTSLHGAGAEDTLLDIADPGDGPEDALARSEGLQQLDQALAALPTELRECLVLHELEELSYKEIAAITAVPIGTVMSRLWRARQALLRWQATRSGP